MKKITCGINPFSSRTNVDFEDHMKDIVKRLREINQESLIMKVVRDCLDAAEEIEQLREKCGSKQKTMKEIKKLIVRDEQADAKQEQSV